MENSTKTPEIMSENPYDVFKEWLEEAESTEPNDPNAMCLATATPEGIPSARIMLLKGFDERGFVFYTNDKSRKGQEIISNANAALCFHWKTLKKQVRVEGILEEISSKESDSYYNTRPRGSRIGAWASKQSQKIENKDDFQISFDEYEEKFESVEDIPRPPYWKGFRVIPREIEFWIDGQYRLHGRYVYKPDNNNGEGGWASHMIYP